MPINNIEIKKKLYD